MIICRISGSSTLNGYGGAGIGSGSGKNAGSVTINGNGVIIKATGSGSSDNIGGGSADGTPVSGGTVTKTAGIVFEGNSGAVYGNVTLGGPLDCDGGTLTVLGGSTLTVLDGGKIINHGTFTNSGRIENHGVIGSVSGSGITHHYVTSISKGIKEHTTSAIIGESLESSLSALSPSRITVSYNGTTRTLTGTWSVTDLAGNPITDLSGTIVGANDKFKYTVTFASEDNIYFDPLNMSLYEMKKSVEKISNYQKISDNYLSALGPGGGDLTLSYSYIVDSLSEVVPPPEPPQSNSAGGLIIQLGANANQTMTITIGSIKIKDLGIDGLSVLTQSVAEKAINVCDNALSKVLEIRCSIGAYQDRLEHA